MEETIKVVCVTMAVMITDSLSGQVKENREKKDDVGMINSNDQGVKSPERLNC